jgi:hypothetical protein
VRPPEHFNWLIERTASFSRVFSRLLKKYKKSTAPQLGMTIKEADNGNYMFGASGDTKI